MKRIIFTSLLLAGSSFVFGQNNTEWYYPSVSNSTPAGYIGIGTSTSPTLNTPLPSYNFQVHGLTDYISTNVIQQNNSGPKAAINYGVTSRIGLTNSMTGQTDVDGGVLQMSEYNFFIKNQSPGDLILSVPNLNFTLSKSTSRAWLGSLNPSTSSEFARLSIGASDNGLYIRTFNTLKYGMRVKVAVDYADALQVFGQNSALMNFKVTGGGEVYARKYTTTLNNIPDYVFQPSYRLMPLNELRTYVRTERHLPNVPSAEEYAQAPVDLGEMNRMLLEKVEELTLYILEIEERIQKLETTQE